MLGLWGLGGDELASVRVDVVEVVVVVVVVVGVVRRHRCDAGGDAPHRLHVRLRGRPAPRPPPFGPPSPPGSHARSHLSLAARGALALALGTLSGPLPVPQVPPPVPHALARPLAHRLSPRSLHLGALPTPLRALSVPWSLPGPLPCVAPSASCALSPSVAAPLLPAACALACSLRALLRTPPVASCPPLRAPVAGPQLCLRAVPSFLDHAPASSCLCSCGSVTPWTQEVTAVTVVHLVRLPPTPPDDPRGPRAHGPAPDWGLWRDAWAAWLPRLPSQCRWMAAGPRPCGADATAVPPSPPPLPPAEHRTALPTARH